MVHKLNKGYPIFQTEAHEPYPELNGGQIRRAKGLSVPNRYIYGLSAQSDKMSPLLYISSSYTSLQFHWIGSRLNAWLRIDTVDCCLLKRLWAEKNLLILSLRTKIWRQMNVMGGLKEFMFPQCDRFHCENLFFFWIDASNFDEQGLPWKVAIHCCTWYL